MNDASQILTYVGTTAGVIAPIVWGAVRLALYQIEHRITDAKATADEAHRRIDQLHNNGG